jgi:hypothetical protein
MTKELSLSMKKLMVPFFVQFAAITISKMLCSVYLALTHSAKIAWQII